MTKEQFKKKVVFVTGGMSHLSPEEKSKFIREMAKEGNPHPLSKNVVDEVLRDLGLPLV
ncbi:hypothetical protein [Bradyrhizobium sp. USDA 4520]